MTIGKRDRQDSVVCVRLEPFDASVSVRQLGRRRVDKHDLTCLRWSVLLDVCAARSCVANVDTWTSANPSASWTSQPA